MSPYSKSNNYAILVRMKFELFKQFKPEGSQPEAIKKLVHGLKNNYHDQTLLGVTGSGKTFTIANVIEKVQKPTLVICHNKTLAAQLCQEFRHFFPNNAVEYFVSYYDYYQPEAYLPTTDTYIEKEAQINEEIDRLRHAATSAILTRRDTIIVASVSCIYGLGSPEEYQKVVIDLEIGQKIPRQELLARLIDLYYTRSEVLERGRFRLHGDIFEIMPADKEIIIRIELEDDKIKEIIAFENVSRKILEKQNKIQIFPAKHFVVDASTMEKAFTEINNELKRTLADFRKEGKILEAERLERRTKYDLEMIKEIGYCNGIENYSRYLTGRAPGQAPYTLIDYLPEDYLLVIDESHVTVPQIGGMFEGDRSRKLSLIENGFRLPSALDNRPLKFKEFEKMMGKTIYTTATPGPYELKKSKQVVEQIVRPTGLVDPEIIIKPAANQVNDLMAEVEKRANKNERVLVTTLTKKMAEDLSEYLAEKKLRAKYLHSEISTIERINILEDLRRGKFDILVGVNLLREGLDLPEVTLVAILDTDKEGFLRSETSLIQTMGRAARNINGQVILYADEVTGSMKRAVNESRRRRKIQLEYNKTHHITPETIKKEIKSIIDFELKPEKLSADLEKAIDIDDIPRVIKEKEREMKLLAKNLKFEEAALIRDEISQLKKLK